MDQSDSGPSKEYILLKKEVDSIQVSLMRAHKPWYKEVSSIVAISALLLSIVSTFISFSRDAENNLRTHLKELIDLPRENTEMLAKYRDRPEMIAYFSSHFNQRNQMIVQLAINEIQAIESNILSSNGILPIEYLTVASSLSNSFDFDRAKKYYEKAISISDDLSTAVSSKRLMAAIELNAKNIPEFRESMAEAISMSNSGKYRNSTPYAVNMTNAQTEIQWAYGEVQLNECNAAKVHYYKAKTLIDDIKEGPIRQSLNVQLEQFDTFSLCK